ncbi:hypothetical protein D3C79_934500 [compost metagenome]
MREPEYTPLLAEEAADVITTKLIIPAAAGKPPSRKSSTKGLRFAGTWAQEITLMMQASAVT